MTNAQRIAHYRSKMTEEERLQYNERVKEYHRKKSALAKLGSVVASKTSSVNEYINKLDDNSKTKILETLPKNGRSNGVRLVKKASPNPVEYDDDAGYCKRCKDTCGQNGCSASCSCLYEKYQCCNHTNPLYKCPANLEKRIVDLQFEVCDETFLVGKY